jgi:hypothetical protein
LSFRRWVGDLIQGHRWALTFFFLGSGIGACDGTEPSAEEKRIVMELGRATEGVALECRWPGDTASLPHALEPAAVNSRPSFRPAH